MSLTTLFTNISMYNYNWSVHDYHPDALDTSPSSVTPGAETDNYQSQRYIAATGVTIFSCLAVTANLILTYAVTRTKYVPRITRHFFTCLALADLIRYTFNVFFKEKT